MPSPGNLLQAQQYGIIRKKDIEMGNKRIEHLEQIKEHIAKAGLSEEEKNSSFKHIEEWYAEDKAFGTLYAKLAEISPRVEALLNELGLI
jgi:hypothetical protein